MALRAILRFVFVALSTQPALSADAPAATGPSFDCKKAVGQVQQLVCKDAGLAGLDRRMSRVYADAVKRWPANVATEQRALQRGWVKGRDDCWKETDVRACTERSYKTRIVELQIKSGQLAAPSPVGYDCTGGEGKPLVVTFYTDTDPNSAVVTYGPDQLILLAEPTASGTRYAAAEVELWEHHGEASLEWFGTRLTCRARDAGPARAVPEASPSPVSDGGSGN